MLVAMKRGDTGIETNPLKELVEQKTMSTAAMSWIISKRQTPAPGVGRLANETRSAQRWPNRGY